MMNKSYYIISNVLSEMSWAKTMKRGGTRIFKRMLKNDKTSTAVALAPIPFVPNTPIGIGMHLYKNPRSAKDARVMWRKTTRIFSK